jgi:tetratricopeptide (TPR) repeat protein
MTQPEEPLEYLLHEADRLIRQARKERKEADVLTTGSEDSSSQSEFAKPRVALLAAERSLIEAVNLLEPELRLREAKLVARSLSIAASEDRKELAVRLADCYGPLGGIARRLGDYQRAAEFYGKGKDLEQNAAYEIKSTYNRVQWIVAHILQNPASISHEDGELVNYAKDVLALLRDGIVQDAWTSADILLLSAILGDRRSLRRAWKTLVDAKPIPDVYKSGLLVLSEVSAKLPGNELLPYAVDQYRSQLTVTSLP